MEEKEKEEKEEEKEEEVLDGAHEAGKSQTRQGLADHVEFGIRAIHSEDRDDRIGFV